VIKKLASYFETISDEKRIVLVRKFVALFFSIGIIMSPKLWGITTYRLFPLTPISDNIPIFSNNLSFIIALILLTCLVITVLLKNRIVLSLLFSVILFLLLQDQLRWQPWVYMYLLLLFPFLIFKNENKREFINYLKIIIIGVYLWSGIHKLSPNFIDSTFYSMIRVFFNIGDEALIHKFKFIGYTIPIIEILIGIFLIIPRFRIKGVYLAIITHLFILIYLSPNPIGIGFNSIVYPWNLAMMLIVFSLFYKNTNTLIIYKLLHIKIQLINTFGILLFWILPLLNIFNLWDHYLSFSLYSDQTNYYYINVKTESKTEIDKSLTPFIIDKSSSYIPYIEHISGDLFIDINKWSLTELNVPFYPESRVFNSFSKKFCELLLIEESYLYIEKQAPLKNRAFSSFSCN